MKDKAGSLGEYMLFVYNSTCIFIDSSAKVFSSIVFQKYPIGTAGGL